MVLCKRFDFYFIFIYIYIVIFIYIVWRYCFAFNSDQLTDPIN